MPSPRLILAVVLTVLTALTWAPPCPEGPEGPDDAARKRFHRGDFEGAVSAYAEIAEMHPEDAVAWFDLAQAHHYAGDYAAAHEAGTRAATFPKLAGVALYNWLAPRRSMPMPSEHEYQTLRHGGVEIPYVVLLPDDYDPEHEYVAAVAFAPGGMGIRSTNFTLDTLWSDAEARADWILVCAAQPSNGWINHPSHHALNALMKHVRKEHRVAGNAGGFQVPAAVPPASTREKDSCFRGAGPRLPAQGVRRRALCRGADASQGALEAGTRGLAGTAARRDGRRP